MVTHPAVNLPMHKTSTLFVQWRKSLPMSDQTLLLSGLKPIFLPFAWAKIHLQQHLWPFVPPASASPKTTWTRSPHKWSMVVRTFCWKVRLRDLVGMAMNTMSSLLGAPGVWRGFFLLSATGGAILVFLANQLPALADMF